MGGAIRLYNAAAYIEDCDFDSNLSADEGGAIAIYSEDVMINDCSFTGNTAQDGGSVWFQKNSTGDILTIEESTFTINEALYGGALYLRGSTNISNSLFSQNSAVGSYSRGGVIYSDAYNNVITIDSSDFSLNEAYYGGAFGSSLSSNNDFVVSNSQFFNNSAETGGAVQIETEAGLSFVDCDFEGNFSAEDGGVFYLDDEEISLVLDGSDFRYNHADDSSGVLYALEIADITVTGGQFLQNYSDDAAGLYISGCTSASFDGTLFDGNYTVTSGYGAVRVNNGTAVFTDCTMIANTGSGMLGVISIGNGATSSFTGCSFLDNIGRGLYCNSDTVLTGCLFEGNYPGGIRVLNGNLVMNNVTATGNVSGTSGGAVYHSATSPINDNILTITNCTIAGNSAPTSGSGIYRSSGIEVTINNSIIWGNTTEDLAYPSSIALEANYSVIGGGFTLVGDNVLDTDPLFGNLPEETTFTTDPGTTDSVVITDAVSMILNGFVLEIGDDGVARTVTAVVGDQVTFTPALASASTANTRVDNWGYGATDLDVDLTLQAGSPCIDSGNDTSAPSTDMNGNARYDDPSTANCAVTGDPECAWYSDMGAYEYQGI